VKWDTLSRRHVLQGLGAALALPLLPSLLPRRARAQTAQKTFIGLQAMAGLYKMYGPDAQLMPPLPWDLPTLLTKGFRRIDAAPRHSVYAKPLEELRVMNGGQLSPILDSRFNPLLPKMNLLQGFDYIGMGDGAFHHFGHFGNLAAVMGANGPSPAMPSIDQVMAWSSSFYANPNLRGRSVAFTACSEEIRLQMGSSYTWADPQTRSGGIVPTNAYYNPETLWNAFFSSSTGTQPARSAKKTLVDTVLADYNSLRQSNRRLGAEDRRRLDLHIAFLQDTQRRVTEVAPVCTQTPPGAIGSLRREVLQAMNDVIVSLISCGQCHAFVGYAQSLISTDPGMWHSWSHASFDATTAAMLGVSFQFAYDRLIEQNTSLMRDVVFDLASKLEAHQLLDDTLLAVIQEHNHFGHDTRNIPIVTFGRAGTLKTGQYLDYRNFASGDDAQYIRTGYPFGQLFATFLQACGVPRSEFEPLNPPVSTFKAGTGYGLTHIPASAPWLSDAYTGWSSCDLSEWLPGLV
jgi:hypothetical protein